MTKVFLLTIVALFSDGSVGNFTDAFPTVEACEASRDVFLAAAEAEGGVDELRPQVVAVCYPSTDYIPSTDEPNYDNSEN